MGKTGAAILGFAGAALALANPLFMPLYFSFTIPGAYVGAAMMIGAGMWSSYLQRKAAQEAMDRMRNQSKGIKTNTRTSQAPIPLVYGQTRAGGNILYQATGGPLDDGRQYNRYLHTIYGISEGPIDAYEGVYINDTLVWSIGSGDTDISSGFLDTPFRYFFNTNDARYPGNYYDLDFRIGCSSQDWFRQINSIFNSGGWDLQGAWIPEFDTDFAERYPLTAVAYTKFINQVGGKHNPIQGVPTVTWNVRGKLVRNITADINAMVWTDNPAHILFDIMTNKQYGWSIPSSKIDLESFQNVASFCAGSGTGWIENQTVFASTPGMYQHTSTLSGATPNQPDARISWNPNLDSWHSNRGVTWPPLTPQDMDPSSYSKLPYTAGSVAITATVSWYAYNHCWFINYHVYDDGAGNLKFGGYNQLGASHLTTLNWEDTGARLPYTAGYAGGDIASGTTIGDVTYTTGSLIWYTLSLHGNFSGQEYDGNAWANKYSAKAYVTAHWYMGYGGVHLDPHTYLELGNVTITATMADNTIEVLTETESGSGIIKSSSLDSNGRSTGGGTVDYGSGRIDYWFTKQPAVSPVLDYAYWANMGYTINGVIQSAQPAVDIVRDICQHFRGYLVYKQGMYQLKVDKADSVVFAFDEDNIKLGTFVINQTPISERPNRIRVKYIDRSKNYSPMDVIYEPENPIITTDEVVIEHTINLPYCVYKDQAYRMAQTLGKQAQLGNGCEFVTGQDGLNVDVGNRITVTWPPAGWVDKDFRVTTVEEMPNEEVKLSCVEYDESVYTDEYTG